MLVMYVKAVEDDKRKGNCLNGSVWPGLLDAVCWTLSALFGDLGPWIWIYSALEDVRRRLEHVLQDQISQEVKVARCRVVE